MVERMRRDRANGNSQDRNSNGSDEKHHSKVPADDGKSRGESYYPTIGS